jgi:hypothetical protein
LETQWKRIVNNSIPRETEYKERHLPGEIKERRKNKKETGCKGKRNVRESNEYESHKFRGRNIYAITYEIIRL